MRTHQGPHQPTIHLASWFFRTENKEFQKQTSGPVHGMPTLARDQLGLLPFNETRNNQTEGRMFAGPRRSCCGCRNSEGVFFRCSREAVNRTTRLQCVEPQRIPHTGPSQSLRRRACGARVCYRLVYRGGSSQFAQGRNRESEAFVPSRVTPSEMLAQWLQTVGRFNFLNSRTFRQLQSSEVSARQVGMLRLQTASSRGVRQTGSRHFSILHEV